MYRVFFIFIVQTCSKCLLRRLYEILSAAYYYFRSLLYYSLILFFYFFFLSSDIEILFVRLSILPSRVPCVLSSRDTIVLHIRRSCVYNAFFIENKKLKNEKKRERERKREREKWEERIWSKEVRYVRPIWIRSTRMQRLKISCVLLKFYGSSGYRISGMKTVCLRGRKAFSQTD